MRVSCLYPFLHTCRILYPIFFARNFVVEGGTNERNGSKVMMTADPDIAVSDKNPRIYHCQIRI